MTPELTALIAKHNLASPDAIHDNLTASLCACRRGQLVARPPQSTGNSCSECGGIMVQTGTCQTCTGCGTSGGCG